jgi:hypothetical protein
MKHVFQSISILALLLCTNGAFAMGSPKIFLANTSPTNSAWSGEGDRTGSGRLAIFKQLAGDDLSLDDARGARKTRLSVFAKLAKPDIAAETDRIVRGALKTGSRDAGVNFPEIRSSLIANRDAELESLMSAHKTLDAIMKRELDAIMKRERNALDRKSKTEQVLDKEIEIFFLHSEIIRELIIRNNTNPNQNVAGMIKTYRAASNALSRQISRGFTHAKAKMNHNARHVWGECDCNQFPADPL